MRRATMFERRLPYGIWDADNHFPEDDDAIPRYIEPRFRDKVAIDMRRRERAAEADPVKRARIRPPNNEREFQPGSTLNRLNPYKDLSPDQRAVLVQQYRELGPSLRNPDRRLELMDVQGVEAVLMFPQTEGLIVHSCFPDDVAATFANVRAFNRYIENEWGYAYANRIFVPATISLLDVDLAIRELEHVLAQGARAILLPPGPINGHSPADPKFDPFWARADEAGIGVAVHINYTEYQRQSAMWSEDPDTHYISQKGFTAFQWFSYWGDRPIMELCAALIFHNFFTRFPNIRVCLSELGSVWVPYALRKFDHGYMLGRKATFGEQLSERPSEIFRRHFLVAPYPEENLQRTLEVLSVDQLVFGSDFPHNEGLDDPSKYLVQIADLSEADQRKIMRENLMGFLAGPRAAAETVPVAPASAS